MGQTCKHDISKSDELMFLETGTSGSRGKGVKRSSLEVRRSKVKVV